LYATKVVYATMHFCKRSRSKQYAPCQRNNDHLQ